MTWTEALLTFASLFLAGVFAFYLENLRERRATRRWVREYLGFWRQQFESFGAEKDANRRLFTRLDAALADWLEPSGDPPDWDLVDGISFVSSIALTPNLFGEGMSAVPPDLLHDMFAVDATVPVLALESDTTMRLFESEIRPLKMRREWPLANEDARLVELYRSEMATAWTLVDAHYDQVDALLQRMRANGI